MQASDLEAPEWATFAAGIADLARQREKHPKDFALFQEWLSQHGPYSVIVDGANVALYGQNFAEGGFSFGQLAQCLDLVQQDQPEAKPLVFLHQARLKHPLAKQPGAARLVQRLQAGHQLYSTPFGSNDDWWVASACPATLNSPDSRPLAVQQLRGLGAPRPAPLLCCLCRLGISSMHALYSNALWLQQQ